MQRHYSITHTQSLHLINGLIVGGLVGNLLCGRPSYIYCISGPGGSSSKALGYGLDDPGSILDGTVAENILYPLCPDCPGVHSVSCKMNTWTLPGIKKGECKASHLELEAFKLSAAQKPILVQTHLQLVKRSPDLEPPSFVPSSPLRCTSSEGDSPSHFLPRNKSCLHLFPSHQGTLLASLPPVS